MFLCRFVGADCCVCPLCVCVCEQHFFPLLLWSMGLLSELGAGGRTQGVSHLFNETCIVRCRGFALASVFNFIFFCLSFQYSCPLSSGQHSLNTLLHFRPLQITTKPKRIFLLPIWIFEPFFSGCSLTRIRSPGLLSHLQEPVRQQVIAAAFLKRTSFDGDPEAKETRIAAQENTCDTANWHASFICHKT